MTENALTRTVRDIAQRGASAIVFIDPDHFSAVPREALGNPALMNALKDNGFTTLNMEFPNDATIQNYLSHAASETALQDRLRELLVYQRPYPEGFTRQVEAQTGILRALRDEEMALANPDPRYTAENQGRHDDDTTITAQNFPDIARKLSYITESNCLPIQWPLVERYAPATNAMAAQMTEFEASATGTSEAVDKAPDAKANPTALIDEQIRAASSAQKGKQAYFWGGSHAFGQNDLDDKLQAVTIVLADKPGNLIHALTVDGIKSNGITPDWPDYAYYASEDRIVALDSEGSQREYLYGAPDRTEYVMTPEMQQACVDAFEPALQALPYNRAKEEKIR